MYIFLEVNPIETQWNLLLRRYELDSTVLLKKCTGWQVLFQAFPLLSHKRTLR